MNKKASIVITLCLIGIGTVFGISLFSRDTITNYPPKDGPIIAFGDSLVSGTGSTDGYDFVSVLSRKIGRPIENLGLPGRTTEMAFEALSEVLERDPSITIILLGGNDYLRHVPIDETFYNLREIVLALQKRGSLTVILGVQAGLLNDRFKPYFKKLAEETGSLYVPNVLSGLVTDSRYMSDAVHPNDVGYAHIAEKVYEAIHDIFR